MGRGFKLKIDKFLLLILIFFILLSCVSLVSASNTVDTNLTHDASSDANIGINDIESYSSGVFSDDVKSTGNVIVNQRNYKMYFDDSNVLKKEYGGKIIAFSGKFTDKGVITIDSENTKITGRNTLFNNTVFNIKSNGVMLTNLNFVLNKEFSDNEGACVLINGDNVTVYNVDIDYNVPKNVTGFGIYSNGLDESLSDVKLVNNTVRLHGNALNDGYNYGVVLTNTRDAIVYGNIIDCQLPLRAVNWMAEIYGGISMDAVSGLAAGSCNGLRLSNNYIRCVVNGVAQGEPTLDAVLIYACHNSTIENNTIIENDYVTKKGDVNYLYGLDLYLSNDVVIYGNDIHIRTSGGKEAHGTAYPIQVTGQAENILIAFNNLSSYSNGPNIGIYSQNYYGVTHLDIISNFINVTGHASKHSWALVAGIEVQDSDDRIMNNTIIVDTVNKFEKGYNVYGISYSQRTDGDHNYNIQYNNVSTNSDHAVALKGSGSSTVSNSIVANNILKGRKYGGNRAAYITGGTGNVIINNTDGSRPVHKMTDDEYSDNLKFYLSSPFKGNGLGLGWLDGDGNSIIGNGDRNGNSLNNGNSGLVNNKVYGNNLNYSESQARNGVLNSTYYTYGFSGTDIASASSSSGSGAGSSNSESSDVKSYEVTKKINDNLIHIPIVIMAVIALILLIIGYKRKEHKE
ncbi:hypothetical protein SAMN05216439_0940 [Methanobrevibacter gottschalkii]|uniref:Right handed beta helix region n=1 Tax=Methanobrevibacter gottschalkii TaxID=190974 RepID=A0A1H7GZV1_9EURY|nr:hypothetical protein SAMN05216439_0940 [Methanobrevibacter gottschalkii]